MDILRKIYNEQQHSTSVIDNISESPCGTTPRTVLRGVNSQNSDIEPKNSVVGIHWLRVSMRFIHTSKVRAYLDLFFGESSQDGRGLWSYDTAYRWTCGVSLNYDSEADRCIEVHNGQITLDCPGGALDLLASDDLHLFITGLHIFEPKCSRIDDYFDDYNRRIAPHEVAEIAKKKDFTGFRKWGVRQRFNGDELEHDEIFFGCRGENGSGKYLRFYDKFLESKGEQNCYRWETEFSGERADTFFQVLMRTKDLDAFASICAAVVGGSVAFVKRTGDKNIDRLNRYDFWQEILDELGGEIPIRIRREDQTLEGVQDWINKQVSPSLACMRKVFKTDMDFFNWLLNVLDDGDCKLSNKHYHLIDTVDKKLECDRSHLYERPIDDEF